MLVKILVNNPSNIPPLDEEVDFPIMLPHEWMAALYSKYPAQFRARVSGEPGALADYWHSIKPNDPRLYGHPVTSFPDYQNTCIPTRLHGDGVPYGKAANASADVVSMSSLTAAGGDSWDLRFCIFAISKACTVATTMDVIWKWVLWSLLVLQLGIWPDTDADGNPMQGWRAQMTGRLCGNFQFCFWQLAADLDWLCNSLHLPHFNAKNNPLALVSSSCIVRNYLDGGTSFFPTNVNCKA